MFIGIQNEKPCFIAKTREELENMPCVVLSEIQETDFAEMFRGKIYVSAAELKTDQSDFVRSVRNEYLKKYVDGVVSNPLRWGNMTEEEKQSYISYRQYLLDFTNQDLWWEKQPKTFEEFV